MALDKDVLSGLIKDNLEGKFDIANESELEDFADGLADAIVTHLTSDGVVVMANGGIDSNGDSLTTNEGALT